MASVLIVDDDALILETAVPACSSGPGSTTTCHSSPLEALSAVELERPDVIIADFVMPEMNGIAFLEMSIARSPGSARILCTGHADSDVVMQAVNAGQVNRIIEKPPREVELVSAVSQAADTVALRRRNEELAAQLRRQNLHLEEIVRERTEALLQGFVGSLDARDSGTRTHSQRVARYARRLAAPAGHRRARSRRHRARLAAPRHREDRRPRPDPAQGRAALRRGMGSDARAPPARVGAPPGGGLPARGPSRVVLQHHERWDGAGYPSRVAGDAIDIGARVFQVVDAYDAITTDRPYHRARPHDEACSEIARASGTQFDPAVVAAFLLVPLEDWRQIRVRGRGGGRAGSGRSAPEQPGVELPPEGAVVRRSGIRGACRIDNSPGAERWVHGRMEGPCAPSRR